MKIYMAPMEGLTGYILRNAQNKHFGGIDKFFTPFITPASKGTLGAKYKRDILPENNMGINLVPQILTDNAKGFITMCNVFKEYGYDEFNMNLGCPSGTVVSKGRGAGFLRYMDKLDTFLYDIFDSGMDISVKTRIGFENKEEFYALLEIYNKYPIKELIIHPRTSKDMYNGKPYLDIYRYAVENSKNKLCYNGDIFTVEDYKKFLDAFPETERIMLGRGVIINPALPLLIKEKGSLTKDKLYDYYMDIYRGYEEILSGGTQLVHKLKGMIMYILQLFEDSKKIEKKIKKSKNKDEFNRNVDELFRMYDIIKM